MDLKRSELSLLISLDVLLDELNVTRAAQRLNLSQSTLSGQLARLRELFADPLLVPAESGRGMVPTERGLALQPRLAQALLDLHDALAPEQFDPASSAQRFVVASNDSLFTILGLDVMDQLIAIGNPALKIGFVPVDEHELLAKMERRQVDLALGLAGKMPEGLKSRTLLRDTFCIAQRKGHPRGLSALSLDEYCALGHVMVSRSGQFQGPIDTLLQQQARARAVVATVPSYNQVNLVLARTDCVATLPRRFLMRYQDTLDLLEPPLHIPSFEVAVAWHPRLQSHAAHRWLRALFVQAASAAPDSSEI